MSKKIIAIISLFVFLFTLSPALAIEVNPTKEQIEEAIQAGKDAAENPDAQTKFEKHIGNYEPCGIVIINTKLSGELGIYKKSKDAARLFKPIPNHDHILQEQAMTIGFGLCNPYKYDLEDIHIVIKQGSRVIQPVLKLGDGIVREGTLPAKGWGVFAVFPYGSFDPKAVTTIIIIPPTGKRIEHTVDLLQIP